MEKSKKTGAAPVSKYAAKKIARAKAAAEETAQAVVTEKVSEEVTEVVDNTAQTSAKPQQSAKREKKNNLPPVTNSYPEHFVQLALIIKNNAEIRRFTALGILNYLLQKGEIKGEHRFVTFKWNKFAVKCNGLVREFSYNEPFFLNALVASFASFSASAQNVIDAFCRKEMSVGIEKAVDSEEVGFIKELNDDYLDSADTVADITE